MRTGPLPGQNGIDDRQAGLPRDVTDDVMQLQIHLVQRLLHVVHVRGGHLHKAFPVPQQRADSAYLLLRPIRRAQQTHRMQELQPLTIGHIGPPPWHVLHMPRIHQTYLETRCSKIWNKGIQ